MCLLIKDIQKQVATEPIKVYKLLSIDDTPPYYPMYEYRIGINAPEPRPYVAAADKYWAGAGYLHAYTDKEHAKAAAMNIWRSDAYVFGTVQYKLVEMYIPEGTAYYWNQAIGETAAEVLEWKSESPVEIGEVQHLRRVYDKEELPF